MKRLISFETDTENMKIHSHGSMEIIFVLSGRLDVVIYNRNIDMAAEDFMVINPYEQHELYREPGSHTLSLFIDEGILREAGIQNIYCCSPLQPDRAVYLNSIRTMLAGLFIEEYQEKTARSRLFMTSRVYALLAMLQQEFSTGQEQILSDGNDGLGLPDILRYISDHLDDEEMKLGTAAEYFYVSPSHLSRTFQHLMGQSFSDYIRECRMNKALGLLMHTDRSVTEIAVMCGIRNMNTFTDNFTRKYGCTPRDYRRMYSYSHAKKSEDVSAYIPEVSYMSLTQYINRNEAQPDFVQKQAPVLVDIDVRKKGTPLNLSHRRTANAGLARRLLMGTAQELTGKSVKELGFQYISIQGIFDRSMDLYRESEDGWFLNYTYLDIVTDHIVSLGCKPWIVLGCTPEALVKGQRNYFGESCMNLPDDLEKWGNIIQRVMMHFIRRYGTSQVKKWYFSMEAAVYSYYGVFTLEEYKEFYLTTYRAIRSVLPDAYITAFGLDTGIVSMPGNDDLSALLEFAAAHDCLPDELSFQSFGVDYSQADVQAAEDSLTSQKTDQLREPVSVSFNENCLHEELIRIHQILDETGFCCLPVSLRTWNSSIWQRELSNDTCFKSAWLVKNVLENADLITGSGAVWLTDYSERTIINPNLYHGGSGIITYYGIPKAAYQAVTILNRLHGDVLARGEGWMICRSEDEEEIMIMLYNYCHFDRKTHLRKQLSTDEQRIYDRYFGFEKKGPEHFSFTLKNLDNGRYESNMLSVSRSHGSSYDLWFRCGAPELFSNQLREYLMDAAVPEYKYETYHVDHNTLLLSILLEPHEVRFISIRKYY